MKKLIGFLMTMLTMVLGCLSATAAGLSPATGEKKSMMPFILAGVAVVLIIALLILSKVGKKK